jgi:hypothetical protein
MHFMYLVIGWHELLIINECFARANCFMGKNTIKGATQGECTVWGDQKCCHIVLFSKGVHV